MTPSTPATTRAGIGLRQPHYATFRSALPAVGFVEVHSENFFNPHDAGAAVLQAVRHDYPVSLHGVGLGLGSACGIDPHHLDGLAALVERIDPIRVSDHASFARASWGRRGIAHANDLLPVAFTHAQLEILCANVQQVQERLRRPILVENLSGYLHYADADFTEPEFFTALCRQSGCGLLLDVNNLMVNAKNAARQELHAPEPLDAVLAWINALAELLPATAIGEIHLAGHSEQPELIVDDHATAVSPAVWDAYAHALARFGPAPTLIEWDSDLPPLAVLLGEAASAQQRLDACCTRPAAAPTSIVEAA